MVLIKVTQVKSVLEAWGALKNLKVIRWSIKPGLNNWTYTIYTLLTTKDNLKKLVCT